MSGVSPDHKPSWPEPSVPASWSANGRRCPFAQPASHSALKQFQTLARVLWVSEPAAPQPGAVGRTSVGAFLHEGLRGPSHSTAGSVRHQAAGEEGASLCLSTL